VDEVQYLTEKTGYCESDIEHTQYKVLKKATENFIIKKIEDTINGTKSPQCTKCESVNTKEIRYYGCISSNTDPKWKCLNCGNEFGKRF
jgi:transposase-like protein